MQKRSCRGVLSVRVAYQKRRFLIDVIFATTILRRDSSLRSARWSGCATKSWFRGVITSEEKERSRSGHRCWSRLRVRWRDRGTRTSINAGTWSPFGIQLKIPQPLSPQTLSCEPLILIWWQTYVWVLWDSVLKKGTSIGKKFVGQVHLRFSGIYLII